MSERIKIITKDIMIPLASVVTVVVFAYQVGIKLGQYSQRMDTLEKQTTKMATQDQVAGLQKSIDEIKSIVFKDYGYKNN